MENTTIIEILNRALVLNYGREFVNDEASKSNTHYFKTDEDRKLAKSNFIKGFNWALPKESRIDIDQFGDDWDDENESNLKGWDQLTKDSKGIV